MSRLKAQLEQLRRQHYRPAPGQGGQGGEEEEEVEDYDRLREARQRYVAC